MWFLHYGTLPDLIDHIDGNPSNNQIDNLREASEGQNRANAGKHSDNTSGSKGVYWDKRTHRWLVQVCVNYKTHFAGRFTDKGAAINAACELRKKLHKEFANHG